MHAAISGRLKSIACVIPCFWLPAFSIVSEFLTFSLSRRECLFSVKENFAHWRSLGSSRSRKSRGDTVEIGSAATSVRHRTRTKKIRGLVESHVSRSLAYTQRVSTNPFMYAKYTDNTHTLQTRVVHAYVHTQIPTHTYIHGLISIIYIWYIAL